MRLIVSEGGTITDRTRWENEADAKLFFRFVWVEGEVFLSCGVSGRVWGGMIVKRNNIGETQ